MVYLFQYFVKHIIKHCISETNTFGRLIKKYLKMFFDMLMTEELIVSKLKLISFESVSYVNRRL